MNRNEVPKRLYLVLAMIGLTVLIAIAMLSTHIVANAQQTMPDRTQPGGESMVLEELTADQIIAIISILVKHEDRLIRASSLDALAAQTWLKEKRLVIVPLMQDAYPKESSSSVRLKMINIVIKMGIDREDARKFFRLVIDDENKRMANARKGGLIYRSCQGLRDYVQSIFD